MSLPTWFVRHLEGEGPKVTVQPHRRPLSSDSLPEPPGPHPHLRGLQGRVFPLLSEGLLHEAEALVTVTPLSPCSRPAQSRSSGLGVDRAQVAKRPHSGHLGRQVRPLRAVNLQPPPRPAPWRTCPRGLGDDRVALPGLACALGSISWQHLHAVPVASSLLRRGNLGVGGVDRLSQGPSTAGPRCPPEDQPWRPVLAPCCTCTLCVNLPHPTRAVACLGCVCVDTPRVTSLVATQAASHAG